MGVGIPRGDGVSSPLFDAIGVGGGIVDGVHNITGHLTLLGLFELYHYIFLLLGTCKGGCSRWCLCGGVSAPAFVVEDFGDTEAKEAPFRDLSVMSLGTVESIVERQQGLLTKALAGLKEGRCGFEVYALFIPIKELKAQTSRTALPQRRGYPRCGTGATYDSAAHENTLYMAGAGEQCGTTCNRPASTT